MRALSLVARTLHWHGTLTHYSDMYRITYVHLVYGLHIYATVYMKSTHV